MENQYTNPETATQSDARAYINRHRPCAADDTGAHYLANLDIPGRNVSVLYVGGLVLFTFMAGLWYFLRAGESQRTDLLPLIFCVLAVHALWLGRKLTCAPPRNWLSPDTFFVSAFYVFHFFYIVNYSFGLVGISSEVFYAEDKVLRAVFYCLCCLSAFLIAYEITGLRAPRRDHWAPLTLISPLAITISKILIAISLIFFWGVVLSVGLQTLTTDYIAMTTIGYRTGGRLFWVSQDIAIVAIAMYCAASGLICQKYMHGRLFAYLTIAYLLGVLALGDRGGFIRMAPIPLLAFHYFQRKVKLSWMVLGALVLFFVMGVISLTRGVILLDVGKISEEYKYTKPQDQNILVTTGYEFGVSIKMVVVAMEFVPHHSSYWYGRSYVDALPLAIPNIIPGYFRVASPNVVDVWLNDLAFGTDRRWGRGGSIAMEAYVNFGFIGGVITFILLGAFYRYLYEKFLDQPNFVRSVLLFVTCAALILWMRNTLAMYIRPFVWGLLAALFVNRLCKQNLPTQLPETYAQLQRP